MNEKISHWWQIITNIPVSKIMITNIKTINQKDTVQDAINLMAEHSIAGMIVVDDDEKPIGIMSEGDMIKKVFAKKKDPSKVKLKEIMSTDILTITPDISIGKASSIMRKRGISKLPVTKGKKFVGYITKSDILDETYKMYRQNRILLVVVVSNMILIIAIGILLQKLFELGWKPW